MNIKQSREIRGLLMLVGLTTSNAVHLFGSAKALVGQIFQSMGAMAHNLRLYVAQHTSANLGFLFATLRVKRSGAASQGVSLITEIIFLAIGIYVIAFILPGALTAIATTALTSVNAGVITMFQILVPIIAIVVVILLLISIVRRSMGR